MNLEYVLPADIERRSFEIIESELETEIPEYIKPVVMRVIHTTADFDYLDNLYFSEDVMNTAMKAISQKAVFVTDTNMAKSGINKAALARHGCTCECFMADPDIAETARVKGTTRAAASVDKAAELDRPVIFAAGNAPTALVRLSELIRSGKFVPELVIGVPVGFVNVVQSKEMLIETGVPCIVARGRKGGSNVAAAICNALLYLADKKL
ncbi:precorrin-8X methylmutase [Ruminococcus sp. HUN007]|uniref:precorrin-8X methylmutase n=1 Tax=Ruminococcus sp. HUN007 TaxID=1514668 RepID=UPI0005D1E6BD|nr:precorrin-8X methylmutase [Ruminococcus sp. HUN007]